MSPFNLEASAHQKSWADYQMARIKNITFELEDSLARYLAVAEKYKDSPFADEALLRAGVIYYSNMRKPEEALLCYHRITKDYPKSNEAIRAAYYIAEIYRWTKQIEKAKKSYSSFIRKYPQSGYASFAKEELKTLAGKDG